ncbi:MAG: aldo/keto reductase family oxidoreductase [Saprospiraceae bacterium]
MSKRIKIAANGPTFSRVIFGTMKWGVWGWKLRTRAITQLIEESIEAGITTFDHADIYGHYTTEGDFGRALRGRPDLRKKMEIITKCGINLVTPNRPQHKIKSYSTSKEHIIASTENSLKELNTDYIDMLLIHRPSPLMHPDEIAEAFNQLRAQGKVKYFGVSNFSVAQFEMLQSRITLMTNQVEASILHLPPFLDGTFDQCIKKRISPMAWSPLGGGNLFTEQGEIRTQRIQKVAQGICDRCGNVGLDRIYLAWLLKHPAKILPVLGTARIDRAKAALAAVDIEMTDEEWFALWEASAGKEVA